MKIEKWSIGTVPYKSVIKNFENIIVRNLWRSIFIIKCTVYSLQSFILLKMRLWLISFPWNFTFVYHYILWILNFRKIYLFYWHARYIWLFSGRVEQILNLPSSHLEMLHYLWAQFWWSVYLYLKLLNYSLSFVLIVDLSYFHTFILSQLGAGDGARISYPVVLDLIWMILQ